MDIIDAPALNIRIIKVGRYFKIYEILPDCMLPNINVGDVILSIGHWEINSGISMEDLDDILQEPEHSIQVLKYRTAVSRDSRALQRTVERVQDRALQRTVERVQEQVIRDLFLKFCFIVIFLMLFDNLNRYDIGIHLAELDVGICTFIHLIMKNQNAVLKALSILLQQNFQNCEVCLQLFVMFYKIQLPFRK